MSTSMGTFLETAERFLGPDGFSVDPRKRQTASRDRYELSPVLRDRLPVTVADVVVWPRTTADIEGLLGTAYELRIPVTPRGKGTGNYGQAVPLHEGVVLDTSRMGRVHDIGDGWIEADAGARIFDLERRARATGQELALMPSTVGSTIGGFIAGGSGGAGSIEHGWIWDGFMHELSVVPCVERALAQEIGQGESRPFAHSYGTTGVISRVVVRLVPAKQRVAVFAAFPDIEHATEVGRAIMDSDEPPRLLSIDGAAISSILARSQPGFDPAKVSLRALVTREQAMRVTQLVTAAGGAVIETREKGDAALLSLAFNHVTERVLDVTQGFCHLQVSGPGLPTVQTAAADDIPGLMTHLDGFRLNGRPEFVGILFHRYTGPPSIERVKRLLVEHQVRVNDPHVWQLQKDLEVYREAAATMDPCALLNPGKLPPESA